MALCGRGEENKWSFVAKSEGKKPLGRLRSSGWEDNIKNGYSRKEMGAWTGLNWPRIGTGLGCLWVRELKFGCHKRRKISRLE